MKNKEKTKNQSLLQLDGISKLFPVKKGFLRRIVGHVRAVDDIHLTVDDGETVGLVGESGCGKTTLGRCIVRAIEPTTGSTYYNLKGKRIDVTKLSRKELQQFRQHMQMIFQDPYSSLDPRKTILDIIGEPLIIHGVKRGGELERRVKELMDVVGLDVKHFRRYPHAFSGGQRQRIGIARALSLRPKLIVCDEPVSALDVSVQAQILNLLEDLQEEFDLTYLFIAHDLSVVQHISDRVAVMYVGKIVELTTTDKLFYSPKHPYTESLLAALPKPDPDSPISDATVEGEVANPANLPSGCYFHPRCPYVHDICQTDNASWQEVEAGHFVACHFADSLSLQAVKD